MSNSSSGGSGAGGAVGTILVMGIVYWIAYYIAIILAAALLVVLAGVAVVVAAVGYGVYWSYQEYELPGLLAALVLVGALALPVGFAGYSAVQKYQRHHHLADASLQSVAPVTTVTQTTLPADPVDRAVVTQSVGDLTQLSPDELTAACQQLGVPQPPPEPFSAAGAVEGEKALLGLVIQTANEPYGPVCLGVDPASDVLSSSGWDGLNIRMAQVVLQDGAGQISLNKLSDSEGFTWVTIDWTDPKYGQYDSGQRLAYRDGRFYYNRLA